MWENHGADRNMRLIRSCSCMWCSFFEVRKPRIHRWPRPKIGVSCYLCYWVKLVINTIANSAESHLYPTNNRWAQQLRHPDIRQSTRRVLLRQLQQSSSEFHSKYHLYWWFHHWQPSILIKNYLKTRLCYTENSSVKFSVKILFSFFGKRILPWFFQCSWILSWIWRNFSRNPKNWKNRVRIQKQFF